MISLQDKHDRNYNVNGKRFQLKCNTVNRLMYYNKSQSSRASPSVDKIFVELLLLSMFQLNDLKNNILDRELLKIIKCKI